MSERLSDGDACEVVIADGAKAHRKSQGTRERLDENDDAEFSATRQQDRANYFCWEFS